MKFNELSYNLLSILVNSKIPPSYPFIRHTDKAGIIDLASTLDLITVAVQEVVRLSGQLAGFIASQSAFINQNSLNVVFEGGQIGIDILANVSDIEAQNYANRVELTHSLILHHINTINSQLTNISNLEALMLDDYPDYVPKSPELRSTFDSIKSSYKLL